MDCSIHKNIKVKEAVNLTEHEVIVVYRDDGVAPHSGEKRSIGASKASPDQRVNRHLVRGPCLYVPKNGTEWVQQFSWHGSISKDPARNGQKVKDAVKFSKLRVSPGQTYFDIESV